MVSVPQARQRELTGPVSRARLQQPRDAAQAAQRLTQTVANEALSWQDTIDEALARDADLALNTEINEIMAGESGYLHSKGRDAATGLDSVRERLEASRNAVFEGLSPGARRRFESVANNRVISAVGDATNHAVRSRDNWVAGTAAARGAMAADNAVRAGVNGEEVENNLSVISESVEEEGKVKGWSPEQIALAKQVKTSAAIAKIARSHAVEDPAGALRFIDQNASRMTGEDIAELRPRLEIAAKQYEAKEVVRRQFAATNGASIPLSGGDPASVSAAIMPALIQTESNGRNGAISPKGALGVSQMLPGTAAAAAKRLGVPYDQDRLLNDPDYARTLGQEEMRHLLERYDGNVAMALAAYNAGPGNVDKWVQTIGDPRKGEVGVDAWIAKIPFAETRDHVAKTLKSAGISASPERRARVIYDTEGKTRDRPLGKAYLDTVAHAVGGVDHTLTVRVVSAGQDQKGKGAKRTGSTRHDVDHTGHAHTSDFVLQRGGKVILPDDDPALYARVIESLAARGFTGVGHYKWGLHVGGGSEQFWGPNMRGHKSGAFNGNPEFLAAYERGRARAAGKSVPSVPSSGIPGTGGNSFLTTILAEPDHTRRDAMLAEYRKISSIQNLKRQEFLTGFEDELAFLSSGNAPPAESRFTLSALKEVFGPDEGARLHARKARAVEDGQMLNTVRTAPTGEISAMREPLVAATKDPSVLAEPGRLAENTRRLASFDKMVAARQAAIAKDPAGYVTSADPVVRAAAANISDAPQDFARAALASQANMQIENPRVLPSAMSAAIVGDINKTEASLVGAKLSEMKETWGEHWPIVLRDLRAAGLSGGKFIAAAYVDDPALAEEIIGATEVGIEELRKGMLAEDARAIEESIDADLLPYMQAHASGKSPGDTVKQFNELREVMIAWGMMKARHGDGSAAEHAVERFLEAKFIDPDDVSNVKALIPREFDGEPLDGGAIEDATSAVLSPDVLRKFGVTPIGPPGAAAMERTISTATRSGFWVMNDRGDGLVLMVPDENGAAIPLKNADGMAFNVPFSITQDPAGDDETVRRFLGQVPGAYEPADLTDPTVDQTGAGAGGADAGADAGAADGLAGPGGLNADNSPTRENSFDGVTLGQEPIPSPGDSEGWARLGMLVLRGVAMNDDGLALSNGKRVTAMHWRQAATEMDGASEGEIARRALEIAMSDG